VPYLLRREVKPVARYLLTAMLRTFLPILVLLLTAPVATAAPAAQVADGKIVVTSLPSARGMSVIVGEGTEDEIAARPPVAGEWESAGGKLVFTPKYPLKPGTKYRVVGGGESFEVRAPMAAPEKPTRLTDIYPIATELPENVLRFYLQFDRPMPRGDSYKYVRLLNDKGEKDPLPFVEIDELWNVEQTRLTLLVDPGRIKKEVKPRIDLGPVFQQGKKYTLVVSGKWPTLSGAPLGEDVAKAITAAAPLNDALDPKAWKITPPSDSKGTVTVAFGRPMDHPLLTRCLSVLGPGGQPVSGTGTANDNDRAWTFRPAAAWAPGKYTLHVDAVLEDVCGNRVGRPFEVDLLHPPAAPVEAKTRPVDLPFVVGR
jgi:hypothetical protein